MSDTRLRHRPSAAAVAELEVFVRRVTGSGGGARHVADVVRTGVGDRRAAGDDRERLFRALCERPALLRIDRDAIEPNAGSLPWLLAELPPTARLHWALRECGGWREGEIVRLCGVSPRAVRESLAEAERMIERGVAGDVLIVGDQPLVSLELRRLLAEAGHTITGVGSTRTRALALAARSPPDLVLFDIERGGPESALAVLRVLEGRLDTPFVVLQDAGSPEAATNARPAAVAEGPRLLVKPCDPDEIRRTCVRALLFDTPAERERHGCHRRSRRII